MRLELNTYEKGEIDKTYRTDSADILYGTVEDVLDVVKVDRLDSDMEIGKMVIEALPLVKPMVLSIFPGMEEEDLRKVKVKELINVVADVIKSQLADMVTLLPTAKN